jgi:hypothetical protein
MMATVGPTTTTRILDEIIEPTDPSFVPEFARFVLALRLRDASQDSIRELLLQNNAGTLQPADKTALDNYLLVGQFLDLLQAKARASLQGRATTP